MSSNNIRKSVLDQISSQKDILKVLVHMNKKVNPGLKLNKKSLSYYPSNPYQPPKISPQKISYDFTTPTSQAVKSPLVINSIEVASDQIKKFSKFLMPSQQIIKKKSGVKSVNPKSSNLVDAGKTPERGMVEIRIDLPVIKGKKQTADFSSNFDLNLESSVQKSEDLKYELESSTKNTMHVIKSDRASNNASKLQELCRFKSFDNIMLKSTKRFHLVPKKSPRNIKEYSTLTGWKITN